MTMTMTAPPIPGVAEKHPYTVKVETSKLVRMSSFWQTHWDRNPSLEVMLTIKEAREVRAVLTRNPGVNKFEVERQSKVGFNTVYRRFEETVVLASELANWASDCHLDKFVQNKNDPRIQSRARFVLHERVREGVFNAYPFYDNGKVNQRLGNVMVEVRELPKSLPFTAMIGGSVRVYDIEKTLMFLSH